MSDKLRYFFFSIAVVGFFALIFAVHPFVGAGGASLIVVVYLIAMHRLYDIIDEECCGRVDPWPPRESGGIGISIRAPRVDQWQT